MKRDLFGRGLGNGDDFRCGSEHRKILKTDGGWAVVGDGQPDQEREVSMR